MPTELESNVLSVTDLTAIIRTLLESDKRLAHCCVTGEISNFKHHVSGHMYFTLKDEKSRIRAVMFAGRNRHIAFAPEDGMRVIVTGSISVFDRDGQYQLYVDGMQPDGVGALYVAFTQLKARLEQEGLFAASRKRPLPPFPRCVGVVTSPTGAVIRDISSTLRRRWPLTNIVLSPALVQGVTAAGTIVAGIDRLVRFATDGAPIDVIVVARGGGSLEELWPFNEEAVARAVAACPIPVVSAVGHETDFTICDFVADVRAATPTAAAELVAPHVRDLDDRLREYSGRMRTALRVRHSELRKRVNTAAASSVLVNPAQILNRYRQSVDFLDSQVRQHAMRPITLAHRRLRMAQERLFRIDMNRRVSVQRLRLTGLSNQAGEWMRKRMMTADSRFDRVLAKLEALNPLSVLRRGYSVIYGPDEQTVIHSVQDVKRNDKVRIRVADGMFSARVTDEEEVQVYDPGVQSRLDI